MLNLTSTVSAVGKKVMKLGRRKKFHRRTAPGAAPGTLVSDKTMQPTQFQAMIYGAGEVIETPLNDPKLIPDPGPDQVLWLDVMGLADADIIGSIGAKFGLHPLALEDVLHVHQRAKAEEYDDYLFVVARILYELDPLETEQVSLFLGPNYVITFQEDPGDCFESIRQRIRLNGRIRGRSADYLLYGLLDAIIDAYFPRLEQIGNLLDDIDEEISIVQGRGFVTKLHDIRRDLIQLRKLLWQHRDALNSLVRKENEFISSETQIYLRDCLDHIVQLMDVAETDRETCIGLQELYLAELGQRTNDVMKILTLIATLFMPMTFIAGVYGMNFDPEYSPLNMPELRWYYGYPAAMGLMGMTGLLLILFFWRRGWFRQ